MNKNMVDVEKQEIMTCECGCQKFFYFMIKEYMECDMCGEKYNW